MKLEIGSLSDIGKSRDHNEDFMGVYRPKDAARRRRMGELFLVADGIGGHQSGEVASQMAVEQIIQAYAASSGQDIVAELVGTIEVANKAIYTLGQGQDRRWRMGTTLVGALIRNHDLHIVNVGDSRAYLVRGGQIEQISQDHSLVAEQVRMGLLDAEQAKSQDYRSAITRALGSKPEVKVDVFTRTLQAGDRIVLCTDGLSGLVNDDEIARIVISQPPTQAVTSLVALANARGGKDNITTIVLKVHEEGKAALPARGRQGGEALQPARKPRKRVWVLAGLVVGMALVLGVLLTFALLSLGTSQNQLRNPPIIAPIELSSDLPPNEFAQILGFLDLRDMQIKKGLSSEPPWPPIKPEPIYVLLTGRIINLESEQPCQFSLDMGEQPPHYAVQCSAVMTISSDVHLAKDDLVSVLGVLVDESNRTVKPLAIDVNKGAWFGLGSEWKNYYNGPIQNKLLVYTVVSSYTITKAGGRDLVHDYGLSSGKEVAVYGNWQMITVGSDQYIGLTEFEQVFRLESDVYKRVSHK